MGEENKTLEISVKLDASEAERELQTLKRKADALQETLNKNTFRKSELEERAEGIKRRLEEAREALRDLEAQPKGAADEEALEKQRGLVESIQNQYAGIGQAIQACDDSIRETLAALDEVKRKYGEAAAAAQGLTGKGTRTPAETTAETTGISAMDRARERVSAFAKAFKAAFMTAGSQAAGLAESGIKKVGERIKTVFSGESLSAFSKKLEEIKGKAQSFGKTFFKTMGNMNVFSRFTEAVGPALKKTGKLIGKTFITNTAAKGLSLLWDRIGAALKTNAELTGALSRLKKALLTAFEPIYSAVVPALAAMLNGLTRTAAAVGRLIAALFGTTAKQAGNGTQALEGEAEALKKTGGAAKEAEGSLASFDEINTIRTEGSGGGGGGTDGGAADEAGDVFEPETGETVFDSWGAAFAAFLDDILNNGIPRLKAGFERLKDWLNGFSQKLYDMFTFDGIRERVQRIGQELAAALNGLVSGIDWQTFGAAIGAGLDLAIAFAVSAIYGFDWQNLGASLADGLNGLIMAINWTDFGKLLWSGFKIAIETMTGFLLNLDMTEIAHSASEMIIGFFNSIQETIANIDWQQVGQKIKTFLVNVDWISVAEAIAGALGAAIGATATVFWELIKEQWQKVVTWWRDKCHDEDGNFVWEGFLEGISNAISNIVGWIQDHIFKPFTDAFRNIFGIHSPSTVMAELGGFLMDGMLSGILNSFRPVIDSVKTVLNGILEFVTGVFTGDWDRAWEGVKNIFRGIWNGIISILEGAVNLVISGINWMLSQLNRLQINVPDWLGGGTFGFNIPLISGVSIPRLAQGAVIPPNREFMAVLGDQRSGNNIEAPESLIRRIVREESGGGSEALLRQILQAVKDGHIIMVDERVLGKTAIRAINNANQTAGRQLLKL